MNKQIIIALLTAVGCTIPAHAMLTASRLGTTLTFGRRAASQFLQPPHYIPPLVTLNNKAGNFPWPHKQTDANSVDSNLASLNEQEEDSDTFRYQRARISATLVAGGATAILGLGYKVTTSIEPEAEQLAETTDRLVENTCSDATAFLARFAPPEQITRLIERRKQDILLQIAYNQCNYYEGSPVYDEASSVIVESDISSVINAERLKEYIRRNNLDALAVQATYVYKLNDQLIVVAENLRDTVRRMYTLKEIQQLAILAEQISYQNWSKNSIVINQSNNMVTLLKTDDWSFYNQSSPQAALESLFCFLDIEKLMHDDARQWLQNRLNTFKDRPDVEHSLSQFDPQGVDFESIKISCEQFKKPNISHHEILTHAAIGIGALCALTVLILTFGERGQ